MKKTNNSANAALRLAAAIIAMLALTAPNAVFVFAQDGKQNRKQKVERSQPSETAAIAVDGNILPTQSIRSESAAPQLGTYQGREREPNGTTATATALTGTEVKIKGSIQPGTDVDFYSFTAPAGARIYAATQTGFSGGSTDSILDLIDSNGTTVIETDDQDGSISGNASSIAGAAVTAAGTYYLRVTAFGTTNEVRPYDLYLTVRSGAPTAETEPNNAGTPQALPASNWVSGTINPAADIDYFTISMNAGETIFVSLDAEPERDAVQWNPRVGVGAFGSPANILLVNDGGAGDAIDSEAFFLTVKNAGTYIIYVDDAVGGGSATNTYTLSATVFPAASTTNCTTYSNTTATNIADLGLTSSSITVPATTNIISSVKVSLNITHASMPDLDVHLRSPLGNNNGLFTDIGSTTQTTMDMTLDEDAAIPPSFTVVSGLIFQPENQYRLDWFRGENPTGTWTLDIYDDTTANTGTLNSWSITVCTEPPPSGTIIYSQNFEANNGGYTHTGTLDEWEYGTPSVTLINSCFSGTNCWKTDLDGTYEASSSQDLLSPSISLVGQTGTIRLNWAMKYQMENATFDNLFVEVREVGNAANSAKVWEWEGPTMTNAVGNPVQTIQSSAGWGIYSADISAFAGKNIEIRFHLDSDSTVQFPGVAIDDVEVRAIAATAAGVSISGRVLTANGRSIAKAYVLLTAPNGEVRYARVLRRGTYLFEDVEAGQSYVLQPVARGYSFEPKVIYVGENLNDVNLKANP